MIHFAHICPTAYLSDYAKYNTAHLILAHLVEKDEQYRNFYKNLNDGNPKIMDNSAFEMWKQNKPMYPTDKLLEMGKACNAQYIVMSDFPDEPWEKTRDAAVKLIPEFKDAGFKTFYVPQGPIGDVESLLKSIEWGIDNEDVDLIGISILSTPNAFGVGCDNNLQRYLSRMEVFRLLKERRYPRDNTYQRFHCLGMVDGPNEITLLKEYNHYIFSWDSSSAVWAGINGITYDNSPTGLINGKFEKEVDFNCSHGLTNQQKGCIMYNINYINGLVK
jgi:hypothetical protein